MLQAVKDRLASMARRAACAAVFRLSDCRLLALALWSLALVMGQASQAQSTQPHSRAVAYRFDGAGRLAGEIRPDPDPADQASQYPATRTSYDALGLPVRIEHGVLASWQPTSIAPSAWPGFTVRRVEHIAYDLTGQPVRRWMTDAAGTTLTVEQITYDRQGRIACVGVRMNPEAYASLPPSACTPGLEGKSGPDRITRNVYDPADQLLIVQKAYGTALQQDYVTYGYSPNGKRTSVTDANGNRSEIRYDEFDRESAWYFPSRDMPGAVSTSDYEAYSYDANGNRLTLRKRDGRTIASTYDALNRVISKTYPNGGARPVYYGYDLRGLQTIARYDSSIGEGLSQSYDGFGRIVSQTTTMGGTSRTLGYEYDGNGNRTRVTHPDGVYFAYEYDLLDRLTRVRENGETPIASYRYDGFGDRIGLVRDSATSTYTYDGLSRLTSYTDDPVGTAADNTTGLTYNPASQITRRARSNPSYDFNAYVNGGRSYATNGLNQYVTAGAAAFQYDANGNLTSDGGTSYGYDIENRLVSARTDVTLAWDPLGRLYQTARSPNLTRFLYDGDELVAEYDGSGTLLRRYVHGSGSDDPLIWYEGPALNDRRALVADHQGSIVAVTRPDGATAYAYDDYGIPNPGQTARFQYTGQAWIPELGMYHYKARIYSPTLGRFLQTDPIGYDDQINLYAYVANDPVNGTDPSGSAVETPWDAFNVALDVASLGANLVAGNYGGAAVDAAALIYDSVATAVPGLPGGAGAALKITRRTERIAANAANGARAEAATAVRLGSGSAGRRVTLEASNGKRSVVDFVTKKNSVVETKGGPSARLSRGQKAVRDDIQAGRPVTPRGANAEAAGLTPGQPTQMKCYIVNRPSC